MLPVISVELDRIEKAHDDVAERAARRDQLMREYRAKSERIHSMNQLLKAYSLF